jgi:ribose/xylose/arabinose/galactoside ABC-type transport system permease subunit
MEADGPGRERAPARGRTRGRRLERAREFAIYGVLILLVLYFGRVTRNHAFISSENLIDVLRQSSILGVASIGMTMVVLTGGIDLAVGSVMALVAVLAAMAARHALPGQFGNLPFLLVFPAALLFGFLWGGATAGFITRLAIPPLVTTLGTMAVGRGIVQWITGAESVRNLAPDPDWDQLTWFGKGFVGPLPAPVLVAALVVALGAFLLHRTTFGTYLYGIGCNEEACRLSGVNVRRVKTLAYGLAGAVFALAGIMNLGRQGYALPAAATGFELDVVTAVVLGGVSITGGEGNVAGVVAGVLILGVVENGLTMLNLQFYEILVVKGAVLLVAVALDRLLRRKAA